MEDSNFLYFGDKRQQKLSSDIKHYCKNSSINLAGIRYFENKMYEKIGFNEEDIKEILIINFIQTYHVSKIGNPSINDVRTSIALYGCIKSENYSNLDLLLNTKNIQEFLIRRYLGNINNNNVDFNTLDETRFLVSNYINRDDIQRIQNKVLKKANKKGCQ